MKTTNMKKRLLISLTVLLFSMNLHSQETFKKRYFVKNKYGDNIKLKINEKVYFKELTDKEKIEIKKKYIPNTKGVVKEVTKVNGKEITVEREVLFDETFFTTLKVAKDVAVEIPNFKASVKFEEDKIYVNPWKISNEIYHLEFEKNRQSLSINFFEWTVNTVTIPLKYRLKKDESIQEEFSSKFNVNLFGGFTLGRSKFFHRKKVGNKTIHNKLTFGLLIGASTTTLNSSNTSNADEPIVDNIDKGLFSLGGGIVYSYNKINIGFFVGRDSAIGEDSKKWNYNKRPWIGVGLGYSLFSF